MTSRTLELRLNTYRRKKEEQSKARKEGLHVPFMRTRDMPGSGMKTRLVSSKTGSREVHLLSHAEKAAFLREWWDCTTKAIFDQVALDVKKTTEAAIEIGVRHPTFPKVGEPAILSTDLVAIREVNGLTKKLAFSVKSMRSQPDDEITLKQRIEKKYWESEGAAFEVVRANGMHAAISKNLQWLLWTENEMHGRELAEGELTAKREIMRRLVRRRDKLVIDACRAIESKFKLASGFGVRAFRQLALERKISFDMHAADPVFLPVKLITVGAPRGSTEVIDPNPSAASLPT